MINDKFPVLRYPVLRYPALGEDEQIEQEFWKGKTVTQVGIERRIYLKSMIEIRNNFLDRL